MTDKQPEALRLAECLDRDADMNWPSYDNQVDAATELRRLHARVEELEKALKDAALLCEWISESPHQRGSINGLAAQVRHAAHGIGAKP